MAKKPVLPLARLAEAKVIKGKGKTKGNGQFPLWAKAKAKAKAMAKQKAKARDYSLASPSSHVKTNAGETKDKGFGSTLQGPYRGGVPAHLFGGERGRRTRLRVQAASALPRARG